LKTLVHASPCCQYFSVGRKGYPDDRVLAYLQPGKSPGGRDVPDVNKTALRHVRTGRQRLAILRKRQRKSGAIGHVQSSPQLTARHFQKLHVRLMTDDGEQLAVR